MRMNKEKYGLLFILMVSAIAVGTVLYQPPISQDPAYHRFRDTRTILGIPNFWNVMTNLFFLLAGIQGLRWTVKAGSDRLLTELKLAYYLLFAGLLAVALGSAYYHLRPANTTLVWDRLPMAIAFMALFALILGEFISIRAGRLLLWPLIVSGVCAVLYWHITELAGRGDLRFYILVQFLPILVIPLILLLCKPTFTKTSGYWLLLFSYLLAKGLEHFDAAIFNLGAIVSGHSLKHAAAAGGIFFLVSAYRHRQPTGRRS